MSSPITLDGFNRLSEELKHLKHTERYAVAAAIEAARDHGDLKENAEYHAAKDRQGMIEARIRQLEGILGTAQVIRDGSQPTDRVAFGAWVTVLDLETDASQCYRIVGEHEVEPKLGQISIRSPIARALMGKREGEDLAFSTPRGERELEILGIRYHAPDQES